MRWAQASSNLALVKYWGKAPGAGNRAARGSLSVTLEGLTTFAGLAFGPGTGEDRIDVPQPARPRIAAFLDVARRRLGVSERAHVRLHSTFPVAAGLASSASTFAALALAATAAAGREPVESEVARLAQAGSGSACRSVPGGFVEWRPAPRDEIVRIADPDHWDLAVIVAVVSEGPKAVGSSEGMAHTAATSPYYDAWLAAGASDLEPVRRAILARDLEMLGAHAERNALRMHAAAIAADPALLYWAPATVAVIERVRSLRREGTGAWLSIDAGPQVKVLCARASAEAVARALAEVPGVVRVIRSRPGGAACLLETSPVDAGLAGKLVLAEAS